MLSIRLFLTHYLLSCALGQTTTFIPIAYDQWRQIQPGLPDSANGACQQIAGYDSMTNKIKIFGGEHHPRAQYTFDSQFENYTYDYNVTSRDIIVEFSWNQNGDIIYYATSSEVRGINVNTGEDQLYAYLDPIQTQINPGICINSTDGTIYLVGSKKIEICTPNATDPTNCTITSQSDLVYDPLGEPSELRYQACEVYESIIYVFGGRDPSGDDVNTIWRCDPMTADSCTTIGETLLDTLGAIHSVKIECFQHNYAALVGGINSASNQPSDLVEIFDMDTETMLPGFLTAGRILPTARRGVAAVFDPITESVFIFGGIINSGGLCTNEIWVTNVTAMGLCITEEPTMDPTSDPTMEPTIDPTKDPTIDPTIDPTEDPTIDPTIDPTGDPTLDPTMEPTSDPTSDPTQIPTNLPTPVRPDGGVGDTSTTEDQGTFTEGGEEGTPWWVWLIIGLATALCCCLIILAFCFYKREKEEEEKEKLEAVASKDAEDPGLANIAAATTNAVELAETQPDAEDSDNELYGRKNITTGGGVPASDSDIYGKGKKSSKGGPAADGNTMIAQEPDDIFDEEYDIHESDEDVMSDDHEGGKITAGGPNAMAQQVSLEGGGDPAVTGGGHGDPQITKAQGENDSAPTLGAAVELAVASSAEDDIYGRGGNKKEDALSSSSDEDEANLYAKGKGKNTRGKKGKKKKEAESDSDSDNEVMYDKSRKGPSKGGPKSNKNKKEYVEEDGVVYGDPVVTGGGEDEMDLNETDDDDEFADDAINV